MRFVATSPLMDPIIHIGFAEHTATKVLRDNNCRRLGQQPTDISIQYP